MLQFLWNQIAYTGVNFAPNQLEHKHIILVNGLSIFTMFFTLVNMSLLLAFHSPNFVFIISFIYVILLFFTIILNSKGKLLAARVYLFFLSFVYIGTVALLQGNQANSYMFFLSEALVVFFIFPNRERKWMYSLVVLSFVGYAVFNMVHEYLEPILRVPDEFAKSRKVATDISIAILQISFSFYIYSTFRKAEFSALIEHDKSEKLLQNILPMSIIKKLRENPDTIAERFEDCTVLFSDIVGFTQMSRKMSASSVVSLLNEVFSAFDDLADKYQLEKIKTIGDAYMVVGGLPEADEDHAEKIATFALDMREIIREYRKKHDIPLELRIGINSGDAVAGVIGKKKFIYDLWGDSVNTASRMESHGIPGEIQVSESTYKKLKDKFKFTDRGTVDVKGIGLVKSYLLIEKMT
jgi:class 3 adenylate cyclase